MDCELVGAELPLRQGDVLKRVEDEGCARFKIVVSADCDLAQHKGVEKGAACIELVPLRDYLTSVFAHQLLSQHFERVLKELAEWIQNKSSDADPDSELSLEAVKRWILVAPVEEIEAALKLDPQPDGGLLKRASKALKRSQKCLDVYSFEEAAACFIDLQQRPPADAAKFLKSQLNKLDPNKLPEELFFVSELPGEEGIGYIALLRNLSFVDLAEIAKSVPDARAQGLPYVRVARLTPTFKHGMAQQLGTLFARIGYPHAYEETRRTTFAVIVDDIAIQWVNTNA